MIERYNVMSGIDWEEVLYESIYVLIVLFPLIALASIIIALLSLG